MGFDPKATARSIDMGICPLDMSERGQFSGSASLGNITLLDFLGGDRTTGPSCVPNSGGRRLCGSPFGVGRGSRAGFVGTGTDVKYLHGEK